MRPSHRDSQPIAQATEQRNLCRPTTVHLTPTGRSSVSLVAPVEGYQPVSLVAAPIPDEHAHTRKSYRRKHQFVFSSGERASRSITQRRNLKGNRFVPRKACSTRQRDQYVVRPICAFINGKGRCCQRRSQKHRPTPRHNCPVLENTGRPEVNASLWLLVPFQHQKTARTQAKLLPR